MAESIVGVGIEVDDKLYTLPKPNRHHHLIQVVSEENSGASIRTQSQGFITSTGRYVLREEALNIAKKANQLLSRHTHERELFSESVW